MIYAIVTDDEQWLHWPAEDERLALETDGAKARPYLADCGAIGEAALYAADRYDLDADWCDDCAAAVTRQEVS